MAGGGAGGGGMGDGEGVGDGVRRGKQAQPSKSRPCQAGVATALP